MKCTIKCRLRDQILTESSPFHSENLGAIPFKMGLLPNPAAAMEPSDSIVLGGDYMLCFCVLKPESEETKQVTNRNKEMEFERQGL